MVLVERARANDETAVAALYERYRGRLRSALRKKLGASFLEAHVDSDDVLHDGILAGLAKIERFEYRGSGSFLAWLLTITERELLMRLRAQRAQRRDTRRERPIDAAGDVPDGAASPSQVAVGNETEELLRRALDSLSERERDVIILRRYLSLDAAEIAEELSLTSAGAARALLSRAQTKLAIALDQHEQ